MRISVKSTRDPFYGAARLRLRCLLPNSWTSTVSQSSTRVRAWRALDRHRQSSEWSRPQVGLVRRMHCDLQSGSARFDIMYEVGIVVMGTWGISLRRDSADAVCCPLEELDVRNNL
jgi:hypothetical protein